MSNHLVVTQKQTGGKLLVNANLEPYSSGLVLPDVDCVASVYVGAVVYMNASGVANNAIATSEATSNIIGIVEAKSSSVRCAIRVLGVTGSIFSSLDPTKEYYLSHTAPGEITTVVPPGVTGYVVIKVGQPYSSDELLVLKGQRVVRT